ncbi:MAG TPA: galactokinase [Flavisolibacter sp.]
MHEDPLSNVRRHYQARFGSAPRVFRSPGRVNIIGEHTDYNQGYVLPAAIGNAAYVAACPRADERIQLFSGHFGETFDIPLADLVPSGRRWPDYILGVAAGMKKRGGSPGGFNMVIESDIPVGAGLSSSAAISCAAAYALNEIWNLGFTKMELARIAQDAEHEFAGVRCGIMDQFASLFGKKDHAMRLDCRSLEFEYVPLLLHDYRIVLFNTNVKHDLATTAYNTRRQQCERGVEWVREKYPAVESLRDATPAMLNEIVLPRDAEIHRRCLYVLEENDRLLRACEALKAGNIGALGKLMSESHAGLSHAYEVSCPELDYLVDAVRHHPGVAGSRMMGGGFGGCTINLVQADAVDALIKDLTHSYRAAMQRDLTAYITNTSDGTAEMQESPIAAV